MRPRRTLIRLSAMVAAVALAAGCGDGGGEPPTAPDPPRPTTLTVSPATVELGALSATAQLSAEVRDQNGNAMTGAAVAWASSNASVATVDASGLVTAVGNGMASVTATSGGASGAAVVTVMQAPDSVVVAPAEATFAALSDTVRLEAEAFDANGHVVDGAEFSWASGDTSVATVDASGLVTAVGNGTASVTATARGAAGAAAVTVMQVPVSVAVTPAEATIAALSDTVRLEAEAFDVNGHVVDGAEFSWESDDPSVATVDASGLVTAVGNGTASVTATAGEAAWAAAVTVMQEPDSVAVAPAEATLSALSDTVRLEAEAFDTNGYVVEGAEFSWESGDASVATVDASGLVTAVGNGTASVTATTGAASGSAAVTVSQEVSTVTVSPSEAELKALGATVQFDAEARDRNGHVMEAADILWASSDNSVATVDASGLATAVGVGTTEVTATSSGAAGTALLRVTPSYTLSGTVTDGRKEGLVVPGVTVVLWLENGAGETTTTDARGRYSFSNLSGKVTVQVPAETYTFQEQRTEVTVRSDYTLDFTLEHSGRPPFDGTPWLTPDILGPSDPTSFGNVTYTGRGTRRIFDRRVNRWVTHNDAYLFDVQFGERTLEWQFNPEFGSVEAARAEIDVFAPALGRLPVALLARVTEVDVNAGDGFFGGGYDGALLIHTEATITKFSVDGGYLEEVFIHEAAHTSLDLAHRRTPGWLAAQEADGVFISRYARDYPDREDIAETILAYFAVRYKPERLTASLRWLMKITTPHRLDYFDEQELDMSPYTRQSFMVAAPPTTSTLLVAPDAPRFNDPPIPPRPNRR